MLTATRALAAAFPGIGAFAEAHRQPTGWSNYALTTLPSAGIAASTPRVPWSPAPKPPPAHPCSQAPQPHTAVTPSNESSGCSTRQPN